MKDLKTIAQMKQDDFKGSSIYKYITMKDIKYILRSGIVSPELITEEGYKKFYVPDVVNSIIKLSLEQIENAVQKQRKEEKRVYKASAFIKEWNDELKEWQGGEHYYGILTESRFIYTNHLGEVKKHYLNQDRIQYGKKIMEKEEVFSITDIFMEMNVELKWIENALNKLALSGLDIDKHAVFYDNQKWIDLFLVEQLKKLKY